MSKNIWSRPSTRFLETLKPIQNLVNPTSITVRTFINASTVDDIVVVNTLSTTNPYKLVSSHEYTVLNNYTVTLTTGTTVNLIKMRNPYGNDAGQVHAYADISTYCIYFPFAEQLKMSYKTNTSVGACIMKKNNLDQFYRHKLEPNFGRLDKKPHPEAEFQSRKSR